MNQFLIVGLGNIGAEYAHTRHNIGFDVVDTLARKYDATWEAARLGAVAVVKIKGRKLTLLKPATYMNLSGKAFQYWFAKEKLELTNTLTIVDDIALPLEKIRLRPSGTHAGHNGLRSIQEIMGTDAYPKLRFGIGNNFSKGRQADFVLSPWDPKEMPLVVTKIDKCVGLIETFVLEGLTPAMNKYNNLVFE